MIGNTAFYNEFQRVMNAWIIAHKTDGAFLWSKGANGYVDLGATYQSYEFAGNKIIVKVDRCFDIEYPTRKFAVMLDLTPDGQSGRSALAFYTFKGGELIHNFIPGVGGMTGLASGQVASPVAGMKYINWGYGSAVVYNPYRSVVMIGEEARPGYSVWS